MKCNPNLPTYSSVRTTLYRARKQFLDSDRLIFKKLQDVKIPKGLCDKFSVIEDGIEDKIVILCSRKMLNTIQCAKSTSYCAD